MKTHIFIRNNSVQNLNQNSNQKLLKLFDGFQNFRKLKVQILLAFVFSLWTLGAFAQTSSGITYHGRLLKPDGTAVTSSTVQFQIQIRTPGSENCLLYSEIQTKDLSSSSGVFSVTLNDGSGTRNDGHAWSMDQVFANYGSKSFNTGDCVTGSSYTANSTDGRKVVVYFNDGTFSGWEGFPAEALNFAPMAIESQQVSGYRASNLLRVAPGTTTTELSSSQWTEFLNILSGSSTQYVTRSTSTGVNFPSYAGTTPTGATAGSVWYDSSSSQLKFYDGTSAQTIGNSAVASITSGTVGGTTTINTSGNVQTSGTVRLYDSGPTNYVALKAPSSVTTNYTMTFPAAAPSTSGYLLSSDTSGNLSWVAPASSQWTTTGNDIYYTTGNVGIGTNGPSRKLEVSGNVWLQHSSANQVALSVFGSGTGTTDSSASTIEVGNTNSGANIQTTIAIQNKNSSTNMTTSAAIQAALSTTTAFAENGYLKFLTIGSGTLSEKMRIDSSGNVGIGTPSPSVSLDIGSKTDAVRMPAGTTAQQPSTPAVGMMRWNSDNSAMELYNGSAWFSLGTLSGAGSYTNVNSITGGSSGVSIAAGGTNQSVTLAGSGTGTVTSSSVTTITNTTASTAYNNGALVVSGGVGVSGNINSNGNILASGNVTGASGYFANLYGGTSASGNITIDSTSNATKGYVVLAPSGGNVGVGTSSPTQNLHVTAADTSTQLLVENTSSTASRYPSMVVANYNNSSTWGYPSLEMNYYEGTKASPSATSSGKYIGRISFKGYNSSTNMIEAAAIAAQSDGSFGGQNLTHLSFFTSTIGNPGSSERIRIIPDGSVGIGTTSPKETLEVTGNTRIGSAPSTLTTLSSAITSSSTTLSVASTTGYPTTGTLLIDSEAMTYTGTTSTTFTGVTRAALGTTAASHSSGATVNNYLMTLQGSSTNPKMVVTGAGNVGIGTTAPTYPLTVAGTGFLFTDSSASTTIMYGASSGKVTIGSSSTPLSSLSVSGNAAIGASYFATSAAPTNGLIVEGNVGFGTASPRASLDVQGGSLIGKPAVSNATSTVDFSTGNTQYTTSNCGSFQFNNLKDGGSYTFIVQGSTSATCSFTAYSDAGSTALTVHLPPDHAATTASKHTMYNILVAGTHAYVAWTPGY